MPRKQLAWTPTDDAFIHKCIAEGTTSRYCAEKLGRSRNSVIAYAARFDLHFVRRTPQRYEIARYG